MAISVRRFDPRLYHFESIERGTDVGIHALEKLSDNQEKSLSETEKELAEAQASAYTEEYFDHMAVEWDAMMVEELRHQQRYAMCLSIFSFLEGRLKLLCETIEKNYIYKIKIKDFGTNDDLMRYYNYLSKVFEADLSMTEKYFTPIRNNKSVRNIISHQDGWADKDLSNQIGRIAGFSQQEYEGAFKIVLTGPEYNLYLLNKVKLFLNSTIQAVMKRITEL